jgi:hypothetical protein
MVRQFERMQVCTFLSLHGSVFLSDRDSAMLTTWFYQARS